MTESFQGVIALSEGFDNDPARTSVGKSVKKSFRLIWGQSKGYEAVENRKALKTISETSDSKKGTTSSHEQLAGVMRDGCVCCGRSTREMLGGYSIFRGRSFVSGSGRTGKGVRDLRWDSLNGIRSSRSRLGLNFAGCLLDVT